MKQEPKRDMVFDTGVLVELIAGTEIGWKAHEILTSDHTSVLLTELNVAELRYIVCRRVGWKRAVETVERLLSTGYMKIVSIGRLLEAASRLKCERKLSLVDCFTIALGEHLGLAVLFAKHEKELDKEIARKPFSVNIAFLDGAIKIGTRPSNR